MKEELKKHIRKVPCLSCLIRFFCFEFDDGWGVNVESPCEKYNKWRKKYQRIYSKEASKNPRVYFRVISELKKIHQEERKTYAKSSKNR